MGNVLLKIDRMSLRELSLRDEKIGKVWFWIRNNCQKSTTLHNSRPLYMANKNIFLFYFIKIFYNVQNGVSKVSRRDVTEGHIWPKTLKLPFFQEILDTLLNDAVFYVLMTHDVVFSLLDGY